MKLFLSSIGFSNNSEKLIKLVNKQPDDIKCIVVGNAMDLKPKDKREFLNKLVTENFNKAGLKFNWLDIADKTSEELSNSLKDTDLLWICGGNVFYLRYLLNKSDMDILIKEFLERGGVYGGDSAGAIIVGPTLKYLDLVDDISEIPEVKFDGLEIVKLVPLPHWGNEKYQEKLSEIKDKLENDGYRVVNISDEQTILIDGGSETVVGNI